MCVYVCVWGGTGIFPFIKIKECSAIKMFSPSCIRLSDFTVLIEKWAGSLLPNYPYLIILVAKQQARGLDGMLTKRALQGVQTFTSGRWRKKSKFGNDKVSTLGSLTLKLHSTTVTKKEKYLSTSRLWPHNTWHSYPQLWLFSIVSFFQSPVLSTIMPRLWRGH